MAHTEDIRIRDAKSGDMDALVSLVMGSRDQYYRLAWVYLGNRDDALDALQDMIVILHQSIGRLRDDASFDSWSKTILVNCCKTKLRQRKRIVSLEAVEENDLAGEVYSRVKEADVTKQDIFRALARLSPAMRETVKLRYFMDMDYQTIARLTRVPEGTVKSRLSTAVKRLKLILGGDYIED